MDSVSVTTSVIQVSVKSVCNIPRTQLEVTEDTRNSRLKYAKSVSIGLVIIGLVYFILYLILAHNARSKALEAKGIVCIYIAISREIEYEYDFRSNPWS